MHPGHAACAAHTLFSVAEDAIDLLQGLKAGGGLLVARVLVWVTGHSQRQVGLTDLCLGGFTAHAQGIIAGLPLLQHHHPACCCGGPCGPAAGREGVARQAHRSSWPLLAAPQAAKQGTGLRTRLPGAVQKE